VVGGRARWAVAIGLASGLGCTQLIGADWTGYFIPDAGVDVFTLKLDAGRRTDGSHKDVSPTGDAFMTTDVDSSDAPRSWDALQNCSVTDAGDECLCIATIGTFNANDAGCSLPLLLDPGQCCRQPQWPEQLSFCYCYAFLCYGNVFSGGIDCSFDDRETDTALFGDASTSATGDVCCIDPLPDSGLIRQCHCYPANKAFNCNGLADAGKSCTIDSLPACSGYNERDASKVAACR